MKFHKYIAYTTHKIVYKLHVSIYKKENAINMKVQLKELPFPFSSIHKAVHVHEKLRFEKRAE